ncbi:MAG: tetratricopeptide repeat protein [Methylotenera sp.]|uniref:tetratricopeptide repeat protein n=1 Tax=Methylotenera sp. TaxID=2051956 RepID=UPI00185B1991|nr:tetratricopeptide repeat protein [Methylotenera sp.]NOU25258.1 tetratricopeptide repeat protein [Methylotenera sp.]
MKNMMLLLSFIALASSAFADDKLDAEIAQIQHEWAKANYQTPKDAQEDAFKLLIEQAHQITANNANAPEALIWEGISNSGYAKAKGGIGALKFAEKARDLFLAAEKINPNALHGSAYTSLGSLYYKVPGWPIGFGDKKKARAYLEKALQANPTGIDPNYFYADFLSEQGDYAKAVEYYKKALTAPARLGREDADAGRRKEAEEGLKVAEKKVK